MPVNQYEQVDNLPDYLKMEEDESPQATHDQPHTPKSKEAQDQDTLSTEAYDDVMAPPGYDSEDYDDVG